MNVQHRKNSTTPQHPFAAADIVRHGESLTVEFKSDRKCLSDRDLVDAIAAMANSGGFLCSGIALLIEFGRFPLCWKRCITGCIKGASTGTITVRLPSIMTLYDPLMALRAS